MDRSPLLLLIYALVGIAFSTAALGLPFGVLSAAFLDTGWSQVLWTVSALVSAAAIMVALVLLGGD